MDCDICGKPAVGRAVVEKATLNVCNLCSRHGKLLPTLRQGSGVANVPQSQKEILLVQGYGSLLSQARSAVGLTRLELAAKLNIREKEIEHFESEKAKPTEKDAKKLESFLKVKILTDSPASTPAMVSKRRGFGGLTLADVVEIKDKRKK